TSLPVRLAQFCGVSYRVRRYKPCVLSHRKTRFAGARTDTIERSLASRREVLSRNSLSLRESNHSSDESLLPANRLLTNQRNGDIACSVPRMRNGNTVR